MQVSVVIPTCNRKARLLSLLANLDKSSYPIQEVIIVDSGEEMLTPDDWLALTRLRIVYLKSEKSVCIQRNIGIRYACSDWIFLCDDDIEPAQDYLQKLVVHASEHAYAGAISGLCLQAEQGIWKATYPENSIRWLIWKFVFQQSMWGEIKCTSNNLLIKKIVHYYHVKRNHITKAGWPVLTNFSDAYFTTPVYGLGAALIKKEWLLHSPFDEVLDRYGIGDNYGVAAGFSNPIHVVKQALFYHHQEVVNRLVRPVQFFRRALVLDYFRRRKIKFVIHKGWLLWSLTGHLLYFIYKRDRVMIQSAYKALWMIAFNKNPYYTAFKKYQKRTEPEL